MDPLAKMNKWHVLAFFAEFGLWSCVAWSGWVLTSGVWRWVSAIGALGVVLVLWATWIAPQAKQRLDVPVRLYCIVGLGLLAALPLGSAGNDLGALMAVASAGVTCVAQWRADSPASR